MLIIGEGYRYHKTLGKSSSDLQKANAKCIKKLYTKKCHPQEVRALMASRLTPSDKNAKFKTYLCG